MSLVDIPLILSLALLVALALGAAALFALSRWRPQALEPLMRLVLRSERLRRLVQRRAAQQLASDTEALEEQIEQVAGREATRQLKQALGGRSQADRERILGAAMEAASQGKMLDPSQLVGKPGSGARTADELRARNKAKSKARAKAKQARRQRKRQRSKRR